MTPDTSRREFALFPPKPLGFAGDGSDTIPLDIVAPQEIDGHLSKLVDGAGNWADAHGFKGGLGEVLILPATGGRIGRAIIGAGTKAARARKRDGLLAGVSKLPHGVYRLDHCSADIDVAAFALGWLLASYRYDRYADVPAPRAELVLPKGVDGAAIEAIAMGEALTRDLINTPASDLGPAEIAQTAEDLARFHGASLLAIEGDALLKENFPMIHAVGRASPREPRLIDLKWGNTGPKLTLVGKGVCFDTGGLNLKPGASMGLMKKDMGGAAAVLGLAHMIMAQNLAVQLRVLVPAVENSVDGSAMRPQDILTSRKGLTVEINNTDAEGRLVLADALALACEDPPDLLISMATLTGAARVAVGPDLAPYYTDSDTDAAALEDGARTANDPVWRLPFHAPYEAMIEPGIADLDNAPKGGFAGSITAALFLRRFAEGAPRHMHFDIYGWQPIPEPTRPKGGVGQGTRALLAALPELLKL